MTALFPHGCTGIAVEKYGRPVLEDPITGIAIERAGVARGFEIVAGGP